MGKSKIVEYLDLTLNEVTKGIENIDSQVEKLKEYKPEKDRRESSIIMSGAQMR